MGEQGFRAKSDTALEFLHRDLQKLADEHGFEVEGEGGKLELLFEEPAEAKFAISANTTARQIWVSALASSFKLGWPDTANDFVLDKTGERLPQLLARMLTQQLGNPVAV